jgi:GTP-binding protein Era
MKSGFVRIVGRTNAGKSTLLNALLQSKIAITSKKSQTTRNIIKGIKTGIDYQIVFLDTPGISPFQTLLNKKMNRLASRANDGADLTILLLDSSLPFSKADEYLQTSLNLSGPLMIVFNKIDLTNPKYLLPLKEKYKELFPNATQVEIGALHNILLDDLVNKIVEMLPEGPLYYEADVLSDQSDDFYISEIIREQTLHFLKQEVPHNLYVETLKVDDQKGLLIIEARIIVNRNSQKAIVIGQKGLMIKKIGTLSRIEIQKHFKKAVHLELLVSVDENWKDHEGTVDRLVK